jgi:hypothetical protein
VLPRDKIAWIGGDNPAREGSTRGAEDSRRPPVGRAPPSTRTEKLRKSHGLTVDQFVAKGGRQSTIARCVAAGLVKLT